MKPAKAYTGCFKQNKTSFLLRIYLKSQHDILLLQQLSTVMTNAVKNPVQ